MSKLNQKALAYYVGGFVLALLLTVAAFLIIQRHIFVPRVALLVIAGLAVIQLAVQVICFLHLGEEDKPRWNLRMFWFMLLIVTVIVFGSIWIMDNLNYHMMSPSETDALLRQQNKKGF